MPRNKRMDSPKYTAGTDGTPVALTKKAAQMQNHFSTDYNRQQHRTQII